MTTQNFSLRGYITLLGIFLCHATHYLFMPRYSLSFYMSRYLLSFYVTLLAIFSCHAACYLFKKLIVSSSYQWNSKNNGSVLLFKALKLFPIVCHKGWQGWTWIEA